MQIKFSTCGEIKEGFEKASPTFKTPSQGSGLESASDNAQGVGHTKTMNEITREEFNARMETIEVKMDARVESVSAKIDAFVAIQAERDKRMESTLNQISTNHGEIKSSIGSMKTTMIVTAVSTVLAIVIGIAGFNAMLTSNMVASFQMGRSERALEAPPAQKIEPAAPSAQQK